MMKLKTTTTDPPEYDTVKNHPYIKDCMIYDIETDSLDTKEARIKWIGLYSYTDNKYHIIPPDQLQVFKKHLNNHRVIIGYNNKNFDNPILENNGFNTEYHTIIDLFCVIWNPEYKKSNRKVVIQLASGKSLEKTTHSNKLKDICAALGFETQKGEIDYDLFKKENWTEQEIREIETYLLRDLQLTKKLWEFLLDYFDNFKEFVPETNIKRFHYVKSSLGSYAYTVICHLAGLKEEYAYETKKITKYKGGYVKEISQKEAHGTILLLDFSSLYPHILIQCNLYSPTTSQNGWTGDNFFPVKGKYEKEKQGKIELLLKNILLKRLEFKKNKDPRQLALKIVLNTAYGITGNPNFLRVHHEHNAEDCTQIGATCIKYTGKVYEENGFDILYGDTDSAFILVPEGKKELALELRERIIKELQSHMPFPIPTWELSFEDELKHIWFVGKKNYIYINTKDKLVIKGISIIKGNASQLGQKILEELKPLIIQNQSIKFERAFLEKLVEKEILKDITIIGQLYNVRNPEDYASPTSLHLQIAQKYGEGNYLLIPNKTYGDVGKKKKYVLASEAGNLKFDDLILEKTWSELEPFIKKE